MNVAAVTAVQAAVTLVLLIPFAWAWRAVRERAIYRLSGCSCRLPAAAGRYPAAASDRNPTGLPGAVWADRTLCPRPLGRPAQGTLYAGDRHCLAERGRLGIGLQPVFALPWIRRGAWGCCWISSWPSCWGLRLAPPWRSCCVCSGSPALGATLACGRSADLLTGGLAAGAALVIMASGLSLNGMQLLLMVALPALGWLAVALQTPGCARRPPSCWAWRRGPSLLCRRVTPGGGGCRPRAGLGMAVRYHQRRAGLDLAFAARGLPVQGGTQARPGAGVGGGRRGVGSGGTPLLY